MQSQRGDRESWTLPMAAECDRDTNIMIMISSLFLFAQLEIFALSQARIPLLVDAH